LAWAARSAVGQVWKPALRKGLGRQGDFAVPSEARGLTTAANAPRQTAAVSARPSCLKYKSHSDTNSEQNLFFWMDSRRAAHFFLFPLYLYLSLSLSPRFQPVMGGRKRKRKDKE
jgi:hypothetical protein